MHLARKENNSFIMHHFKATPIEYANPKQKIIRPVQQAIVHQVLFSRILSFNLIVEGYNRTSHRTTSLSYLKIINFEHHLDLIIHYALLII